MKKFNKKESHKEWRNKNSNKIRAWCKQWRQNNPIRARMLVARWKKNNPEKRRSTNKKSSIKSTQNLTDNYIRTALYSQLRVNPNHIIPEMIELKREQIILHRAIRSLMKAANGTD